MFNRALREEELFALTSASPPVTGEVNLCANQLPPPPPVDPVSVAFAINTTSVNGTLVRPELYGHDLEFTRHDLFEGLSAEILANRKSVRNACLNTRQTLT